MSVYTTIRRSRPWQRWTRPRCWAPRRWQAFIIQMEIGDVYGVARQGFGSALVKLQHEGVDYPLIGISYYGDLTKMQRRKVADGKGEGVLSAADMTYKPLSKLSSLLAHLALTKYEDGTDRTPGRMRVETKGALWQVSLEDVDTAAVLRVSAPTFSEALQHANLLLESPDTMWEPASWLRQEPKKRKGK